MQHYNLIVLALSMFLLCAVNINGLISTIKSYISSKDNMQIIKQQINQLKQEAENITNPAIKAVEDKKAEETEEHWRKKLKSMKLTFIAAIVVSVAAILVTLGCGVYYFMRLLEEVH